MEDLCLGASSAVVVDTRAGRAAAVCSFVHERLIVKRRGALDAMKEGFCYAADLRTALQLFTTQELADRFMRQIWLEPARVLAALKFDESWKENDPTPAHFRELITRWGESGGGGQDKLRQLLVWGTASDDLASLGDGIEDGGAITVEMHESSGHMPSAATCTRLIYLPPGVENVEALEGKLLASFKHSNFGNA